MHFQLTGYVLHQRLFLLTVLFQDIALQGKFLSACLDLADLALQLAVFQCEILVGIPDFFPLVLQLTDAHLPGIDQQGNLVMLCFQAFQLFLFLLRQALIHGQLLLQTIGSLQCLLACCLQFFQLPFPSQKIAGILEGTTCHGTAGA